MGFWSSVGSALGRGIEKVGNIIGSERVSNFGRNIQDACAEKIASEKSYDRREANTYTTDRLNEILVSFSEGYLQQANQIENACVREIEIYYDHLIDTIENAASGVTYNKANLKALKNGKKRISKSIIGGIKNPLARRMSIDDPECLAILKMDAGNEKQRKMTNFSQKVIREALDNLSKHVRESLDDQTEDIQDYLSNVSEEQERERNALRELFEKFNLNSKLEQSDREKSCVIPLISLEASERVYEILN